MASERSKPTDNFQFVLMGATNDASLEPRMVRVDPSTNRLLVDVGTVTISSVVVNPSASSTALSQYRGVSVSNTAIAVKASSGRLFNYHIYNAGTLDTFLQLYDVAQGSVSVGTTTPNKTFWIPAGGALDGSFAQPVGFATAITIAATTTVAGGTAPATALLVNFDYI